MTAAPSPRAALLGNANFRWLLGGGAISMLGDQMTMIALPWLVLKLTGDTLALGLVIAAMSIPRAVFILIGGALVDRYSPKRVLMLSKFANAALLALLVLLVLNQRPEWTVDLGPHLSLTLAMTPHMTLYIIYALALGIGLAQAFGIPSGTSMMPRAIAPAQLEAANGMLMGLRQLTMLAGPLLAALLLAVGSGAGLDGGGAGAGVAGARAMALAFGVDCASFVVSAWTLSRVSLLQAALAAGTDAPSIWRAIGAGLAMVWRDLPLRLCFIYWGTVTLLIGGVIQVALPVLAVERLHGAGTLGLLMGANGGGMLVGMALAAVFGKRLQWINFGAMLLLIDALAGLLVIPLGSVTLTWQAAALMLAVGVLSGFMQVSVFSWLQRRVPPHMMGRAMSIFMFIFMGLTPLSAAGAGWLLRSITLGQLFAGGGALLAALAALAYLLTPMRHIRGSATLPSSSSLS